VTNLKATNTTGGDIDVNNAGALTLHNYGTGNAVTSPNGNLIVTAGGDITQSGPVVVGGTTNVNANAGANAVTLTDAGNDFTGAVTSNGTVVQLTDTNALLLGATTGGTSVAINAGGDVTQNGATIINTPLLTVNTTAGAVTLTNANTVGNLGASSATTTFSLTDAAGGLNVTGAVSAGSGLASLSTTGGNLAVTTGSVAGAGVTLASGTNDVTLNGTVNGNAGSVTLNAGGLISQTATGTINTTGLLATTSATGTTLAQANTVGSFNATNSTSGNISLINTARNLSPRPGPADQRSQLGSSA